MRDIYRVLAAHGFLPAQGLFAAQEPDTPNGVASVPEEISVFAIWLSGIEAFLKLINILGIAKMADAVLVAGGLEFLQ